MFGSEKAKIKILIKENEISTLIYPNRYGKEFICLMNFLRARCSTLINPLRPNRDLNQTSHCHIKGLSFREVMRIENMITQVKFY